MVEDSFCIIIDPDLRDLVPGYLGRRRHDLRSAQDALLIANYPVLQKIGHNVRGSAGSYGFHGLDKIADRLERAAVAQNIEAARRALDDMGVYLSRLSVRFGA